MKYKVRSRSNSGEGWRDGDRCPAPEISGCCYRRSRCRPGSGCNVMINCIIMFCWLGWHSSIHSSLCYSSTPHNVLPSRCADTLSHPWTTSSWDMRAIASCHRWLSSQSYHGEHGLVVSSPLHAAAKLNTLSHISAVPYHRPGEKHPVLSRCPWPSTCHDPE